MEKEEWIAWGTKEDAIRGTELATVDSEIALKKVQAAAKARRKAAGLSAGQAIAAIQAARLVPKGGP